MKKFFCIIMIALFVLSGCMGDNFDKVSYKQSSYLIGECEEFSLTVISGHRESPYLMDGERGDLVEFCTITLKPRQNEIVDSYVYEVNVGEKAYTGSLNKDTFGTTLSGDIGVDVGEELTVITIKWGDNVREIMLENMMANALISQTDALKLAGDSLSDTLNNLEEGDSREVYIKFVSDIVGDESIYYWYVAYVGKGGRYSAVLIDIVSGDIIAKRV